MLIEWNLYRVCFISCWPLNSPYFIPSLKRHSQCDLQVNGQRTCNSDLCFYLIIQALRKIQSKQRFGHFQNDITELVLLDIKWTHATVAKCIHAAHSWGRHAYAKHNASQKSTGDRVSVIYKNQTREMVWTCVCRMKRWQQSSRLRTHTDGAIHWRSE